MYGVESMAIVILAITMVVLREIGADKLRGCCLDSAAEGFDLSRLYSLISAGQVLYLGGFAH